MDKGYQAPTQKVIYQTIYAGVIRPNELVGGGKVLTYKEALAMAEKWRPNAKEWYPYERYYEDLTGLIDELGTQKTVKGFEKAKRKGYQRSIDSAFGEGYFDIGDIPTEELRDILNEAWALTRADPDGSPTFAEHLQEVLLSYGYSV